MSDELEQCWNQEYRNFMLSFYPESSPLVSTWEIYKEAKRKSQKEIKTLLELIETLNQIRDNLQYENTKRLQENARLREEIHRLKDLVMRAKPWARVYKYEGSFLGMEQWLKDSEVIGD